MVTPCLQERWHLLEQYVIQPRSAEKAAIAARRLASRYDYADELFGIRRKDFWPLSKAPYLLQKVHVSQSSTVGHPFAAQSGNQPLLPRSSFRDCRMKLMGSYSSPLMTPTSLGRAKSC